jgi:integrase
MATGRITKREVERLAEGWLWDDVVSGFGVRRQKDGAFYYVRYRLNGGQRIKSLGRHGHLTTDAARREAKAKLGKAAVGLDPFPVTPTAIGFGKEVERYLTYKRGELKPTAFIHVDYHLSNLAKPLHGLELSKIDRRTVAQLLNSIQATSGPASRNRFRSSLLTMFTWLIKEGLTEVNPVSGTGKAIENQSRDRVLSEAELKAIWQALGEDHFGLVVRLLILTGQRRDEIAKLRWSEIDFDKALIVLPPARVKNNTRHELPISPQALAILCRLNAAAATNTPKLNGNGGRGNDTRVFDNLGWTPRKRKLDAAIALPHWTLHDIRRSVATGLAELGVLPHIIECCLNHISGFRGGVAGIYNRNRYLPEMREALQLWSNKVDEIVGVTSSLPSA